MFPIQLTQSNPEWKIFYSNMEATLQKLLDGYRMKIHHIGSTAIAGIWAKPIVDILIEMEGFEAVRTASELLHDNGFRIMSSDGSRISLNHGYTEEGFAERVYHIHFRVKGDCDELYFRDYPNTHPDVTRSYEKLKLELWEQFEFNRDAYTNAKSDFIKKYTELAKTEYAADYELGEISSKPIL